MQQNMIAKVANPNENVEFIMADLFEEMVCSH